MKHYYRLFVVLLLVSFSVAALQAQNVDAVVAGLKTGNAAQVAKSVGTTMQLTIADKTSTLKKAEAESALKSFFGSNAAKGFDLKHKGSSPGGNFAVGTLQTSGGSYRVNIFMKKEKGGEVIKELRFQLIE